MIRNEVSNRVEAHSPLTGKVCECQATSMQLVAQDLSEARTAAGRMLRVLLLDLRAQEL